MEAMENDTNVIKRNISYFLIHKKAKLDKDQNNDSGVSKSLLKVHIIINRLQDVFQQLSRVLFASQWYFNSVIWFLTYHKELSKSIQFKACWKWRTEILLQSFTSHFRMCS